jgi:hypothetical protein
MQTYIIVCFSSCPFSYSQITKQQFAKQIGVHIRDLRIVEKSPGNRVEAAINPRNNTVILSIENMKLGEDFNCLFLFVV